MSAHDPVATERADVDAAEPIAHRERVRVLDGARGTAILAVMFYHFSLASAEAAQTDATWLDDIAHGVFGTGWIAIDFFFVLSGFLITGILLDSKGSTKFFRHFYIRRALRTLPAYAAAVVLIIALVPLLEPNLADSARAVGDRILWYGTFTINVFVPLHPVWSPDLTVAGHLWSMAVEEQFYLIWPVVVMLLTRRALLVACCCAVFGALAIRTGVEVSGADSAYAFQLMPARMDGMAVGGLVALAARNPAHLRVLRTWAPWCAAVSTAVLAVLFITLGELAPTDGLTIVVGFSALAVLFGSLLVYWIGAKPGDPAYGALVSAPLQSLGRYSYAMYLFHLPLGAIFMWWVSDLIVDVSIYGSLLFGQILFMSIAGASSYAIAWLSWRLLEGRLLRLKRHFRYGAEPEAFSWARGYWLVLPVALAAVGIASFVVVRDGWSPRPAPNDAALEITSSMFREDETGAAIRIMLVGDSITRSLSAGLYGEQDIEGFVLRDISVDSCGVMPGYGRYGGTNLGAKCDAVRERWRPYVDLLDPDVVVLQMSHWDGVDRTIDGREVEAGSPTWQTNFRAALQDAVDIFSSRGASVVLLTAPYIISTTIEPVVVDQLNESASFVAEANSRGVSLVDLDRLLNQDGDYRRDLKGIEMRSNDDIHFTLDGAEFVGGWLAPQLIEVAVDRATDGEDGLPAPDGLNRLTNPDTIGEGAWQGWRSVLASVDDSILVSSNEIAYSAFVTTDASDLSLTQGETYVALAWVRSDTEAADGEIEIGVREDGAREGESIEIYPMTNYWQPILVEHTVTKADPGSLELLILRLGVDANPDAFLFRDAELRLTPN